MDLAYISSKLLRSEIQWKKAYVWDCLETHPISSTLPWGNCHSDLFHILKCLLLLSALLLLLFKTYHCRASVYVSITRYIAYSGCHGSCLSELTFCVQPHVIASTVDLCAFGMRRVNISGRDEVFELRGSTIGTSNSVAVQNPIVFNTTTVSFVSMHNYS